MLDRARRSHYSKKKIAKIGLINREIIAKKIFLLPINFGYAVSWIDPFGTLITRNLMGNRPFIIFMLLFKMKRP